MPTSKEELGAKIESLQKALASGNHGPEQIKALRADLEKIGELVEDVQGSEKVY